MEKLNINLEKNNAIDNYYNEQLSNIQKHKFGKNLSEKDKKDIDKVARGFESLFLNMMIKEMKSAQLEESDDGGFGSDVLMDYSNLLFADQISNAGTGIGIAQKVYESMTGEKITSKTIINPNNEIIDNSVSLKKPEVPITSDTFPNGTFLDRVSKRISKYQSDIENASIKYNIPQELIKAVITTESAGKFDARSSVGAKGLMQLMDGTAKDLGVNNSFDPSQNIMGGSSYLRQMLDKYDGNVKFALAAYNAGPGNVDKYNGIPPFRQTQNYVNKVLNYMNKF